MTKPYELYREPIQIAQGYNLNAYKRDGLVLNASPLEEYVRLTASGLDSNQTAIFDLDSYGLDLMPVCLLVDFVSTVGNVTFTVKRSGDTLINFIIEGSSAAAGIELPKIPVSHANAELWITPAEACNAIWLSSRQIVVLPAILPSSIV